MKPVAVRSEELDVYLPLIGWHLAEFTKNGQLSADDMVDQIRRGERQLWLAWDDGVRGALLTCVLTDRMKTVVLTHCAGEGFRDWLPMLPLVEAWARGIGADRIEANARPGWERFLKGYGMEKTHVVMEKVL